LPVVRGDDTGAARIRLKCARSSSRMNLKKRFRKIHLPRLTIPKHMIIPSMAKLKNSKPKEILRTSHVLWAYTGRQRTIWRKTELVRIKLRIKSVLVKMDVQHPH
jgi:hypothetical protein